MVFREKAICFKTVIWSSCFSACSAPVPGQDSFLSPRMPLFLVSFWSIPWYSGLTHKHMTALLTCSRQQARCLKTTWRTTWRTALLQHTPSQSPSMVLLPCYTSALSSPRTQQRPDNIIEQLTAAFWKEKKSRAWRIQTAGSLCWSTTIY